MTPHRCAVPDCTADATGFFCTEHYFQLPPKQAKWLVRWQIKMAREQDSDTRQHMREQMHGYVQEAIRTIQKSGAMASQAAPDSARRLPHPRPAAGANYRQVRT